MIPRLTPSEVFERPWSEEKGDYLPTNHFLPGADAVKDIHLSRIPGTDDPRQCGNALVDIEQRFVCHSPTGFEWGYGGSGPSDLALNILGLFVPPPEAWRLHHDYKFAVIGAVPYSGGTITAESVREWLKDRWAAEVLRRSIDEAKA